MDQEKINQFIPTIVAYCVFTSEDNIKTMFSQFDTDNSGFIDGKEINELIKKLYEGKSKKMIEGDSRFEAKFKKCLDHFDSNKDGKIDFSEFEDVMGRFVKKFLKDSLEDKGIKGQEVKDNQDKIKENLNSEFALKVCGAMGVSADLLPSAFDEILGKIK